MIQTILFVLMTESVCYALVKDWFERAPITNECRSSFRIHQSLNDFFLVDNTFSFVVKERENSCSLSCLISVCMHRFFFQYSNRFSSFVLEREREGEGEKEKKRQISDDVVTRKRKRNLQNMYGRFIIDYNKLFFAFFIHRSYSLNDVYCRKPRRREERRGERERENKARSAGKDYNLNKHREAGVYKSIIVILCATSVRSKFIYSISLVGKIKK